MIPASHTPLLISIPDRHLAIIIQVPWTTPTRHKFLLIHQSIPSYKGISSVLDSTKLVMSEADV